MTLRNDSSGAISSGMTQRPFDVVVIDERDEPPGWPPGTDFVFLSRMLVGLALDPGETTTEIVNFHVPPAEMAEGYTYSIVAHSRSSRGRTMGSKFLDQRTNPIPLEVTIASTPAQELVVEMELRGWEYRLTITDGEGTVPQRPLWGGFLAATANSSLKRHLRPDAVQNGGWSGSWDKGEDVAGLGWISGEGYVTGLAEKFVPGTGLDHLFGR